MTGIQIVSNVIKSCIRAGSACGRSIGSINSYTAVTSFLEDLMAEIQPPCMHLQLVNEDFYVITLLQFLRHQDLNPKGTNRWWSQFVHVCKCQTHSVASWNSFSHQCEFDSNFLQYRLCEKDRHFVTKTQCRAEVVKGLIVLPDSRIQWVHSGPPVMRCRPPMGPMSMTGLWKIVWLRTVMWSLVI